MRLVHQLHAIGVVPGSVLVVHASFRAVGPVEGGPHGLIDALRDAIGPNGTLVMPSMTSSSVVYDPAFTPTKGMGIVAETFRRLPDVLRGDHPTSSFAALGPQAAYIAAPQPVSPPHGPDSPVGRVHDLDGWVLLLGVDHTANTTIHLAECIAGVPYRVSKTATVLVEGRPQRVTFAENDHCCRHFALVDDWLRHAGLQAEGTVGNAHVRLARSRDIVRIVAARRHAEPALFLHPRGSCYECDAAWASIPST
jgi:aminoglycoside 3-N-acetyltransferase